MRMGNHKPKPVAFPDDVKMALARSHHPAGNVYPDWGTSKLKDSEVITDWLDDLFGEPLWSDAMYDETLIDSNKYYSNDIQQYYHRNYRKYRDYYPRRKGHV